MYTIPNRYFKYFIARIPAVRGACTLKNRTRQHLPAPCTHFRIPVMRENLYLSGPDIFFLPARETPRSPNPKRIIDDGSGTGLDS